MLQGKISEQEGIKQFEEICRDFPAVDKATLVEYMKVVFACDAGAYASDARFIDAATGETRSLRRPLTDHLYQKPGGRITRLKPSIVERIDKITT